MSNLKIQLVLAKIESVYLTDPVPTGVANAMLVAGLKVTPLDQQEVERDFALNGFDTEASIPYGSMVRISFTTDMVPSSVAADTPPPTSVLWRACAFQETIVAATSVAYVPITASMESATLYAYQGDTLHKIKGARGTVTMDCTGAEPRLSWELTGVFSDPTDGALPTPTYPGALAPKPVNKANTDFTLNAATVALNQFSFQVGNKIVYRDKPNYESIDIDDRTSQGTLQFHQPALATLNAFTLAGSRGTAPTLVAAALTHKLGGGRNVALAITKLQLQKPDYGADGNQRLISAGFMVRRNPAGAPFSVTFT